MLTRRFKIPLLLLIVRTLETIMMMIADTTSDPTTATKRYITGLIPKSAVNFKNSKQKKLLKEKRKISQMMLTRSSTSRRHSVG